MTIITFWNRREVYMGYSMERCSDIRSILSQHAIKYQCKAVSRHNSRVQPGVGGILKGLDEKVESRYLYYVYVHKTDYDKACKVIADKQ